MLTHTNGDVDRDVEKSVKDDRDVEKSVSMHLHTLERPYKRQIVTDTNYATHHIYAEAYYPS